MHCAHCAAEALFIKPHVYDGVTAHSEVEMSSVSSALEGMFIKSRYGIQRHVATGGMAAVFRGWDYRIERPVAIKVLRQFEQATSRDIERFRREAQAAATLDHPRVVQVYDFFEESGCWFLVMEYVDGINLKRHLRGRGPLPPGEACALGEQICAALEAAHSRGFIHRDIKPQNVLLDRQGSAKLTDFGIVHVMCEARMTTTGAVLGTADYIAPEQARGEPLTPASDLYAVGVMLYELLTGRLPFTGRTPLAVATQHATVPAPPPSRFVPGLSPYIEAVVMRALQKRPERRYQSAARMGLALQLAREAAARFDANMMTNVERGGDAGDGIADAHSENVLGEAATDYGEPVRRARSIAAPRASTEYSDARMRDAGAGGAAHVAVFELGGMGKERGAALVDSGQLEKPGSTDAAGATLEQAVSGAIALRWPRLGVAGLAVLALLAMILLMGFWLHAQFMLGSLMIL